MLQTVQTLAKKDTQVVNLVLANQMDILEDRLETAITAIQILHDKKLAVDFLTHDQLVTLYDPVNKTAANEGYTLLPKQISDLFQIEASYLRHQQDIVIILHVPCVNKDEIMKVYWHLPFPIPIPKQILHHDMTIRQSMLWRLLFYKK